MKNRISLALAVSLALSVATRASVQTDRPRDVEVELVDVDPSRRVVVIKDSKEKENPTMGAMPKPNWHPHGKGWQSLRFSKLRNSCRAARRLGVEF